MKLYPTWKRLFLLRRRRGEAQGVISGKVLTVQLHFSYQNTGTIPNICLFFIHYCNLTWICMIAVNVNALCRPQNEDVSLIRLLLMLPQLSSASLYFLPPEGKKCSLSCCRETTKHNGNPFLGIWIWLHFNFSGSLIQINHKAMHVETFSTVVAR